MGNIYSLTIAGQTFAGNTNFPSDVTAYTPLEAFTQTGVLTLESPTITPANNNTDLNLFDVGFYAGNIYDITATAGEIQWASNNAVHAEFNEITGASVSQIVGIDETFQSFDSATNTLTMAIDPATAPITQLDSFIKLSSSLGLTAPVQIVGGTVTLQFSSDFTQVNGTATFIGNGYIEPGAYAWQANFSGILTGNFIGLGESGLFV